MRKFTIIAANSLVSGMMLIGNAQAQQTPATSTPAATTPAAPAAKTPQTATTAKAPVKNPATAEKYRALTPEDGLSCKFSQDLTLSLNSPLSGNMTSARGHFDCIDKEGKERSIDLKSAGAVGGKVGIKTKDFGTIFRGNGEGTLDKYEMTEGQIKKLKAFLGIKASAATNSESAARAEAPVKKLATAEKSAETPALTTQKDKASYALGMNVGKGLGANLRQQSVEVDQSILLRGVKDSLAGGKTLLTDDEMKAALTQLQTEMRARQEEKMKLAAEANKKVGEEFLAANKTKDGVVTLPSGLQYKILIEGTGPKPSATDSVTCNYQGTLLDGKEFDSSYKRGQPAAFPVSGVIKGWTEALQLMPVGSKWQLFIPSDLGYGDRGADPRSGIGPGATLIFEVELLSIQGKDKLEAVPK